MLEYGEGEGDGMGEVAPGDTQSSSNDRGVGLDMGGGGIEERVGERLGKGTR
jgi:hypothetical protein